MDALTDLSTNSLIGLFITTFVLLTGAAYLTGVLDPVCIPSLSLFPLP